MMLESLRKLFSRDIDKLKEELLAYSDESLIWYIDNDIKNSAGNLALHLVGNLNWFIGSQIGNSGYVRERELEFLKEASRDALLLDLEETKRVVDRSHEKMTNSSFEETYPVNVFGEEMSITYFLLHLSSHLSYHLGQVNYHRRFFDS